MSKDPGKRAELLSPAGDPECFFAAMNAGADAVYAGLKRFGARNYACNFTVEQFISAIDYAHLFDKKLYLTLNILMKDAEMEEVDDCIRPLYKAGLDGVIVQDIGLISHIIKEYPHLDVHVSTQAFVTGVYGASVYKKMGAKRVVPARELSLKEIRLIREKADIEVECFIHGAMCYSYSGMCLMSSFLGGRSGNRGCCAGPCRQPYNGNDYILSMKDLCTVKDLSALLEAGVDSLKIEGRMKSKEYVYAVTKIYREFLDGYYEKGIRKAPEKTVHELSSLYSRSGLNSGYLFSNNGGEMITRERGSYTTDLPEIGELKEKKLNASCEAVFKKGEEAFISLEYKGFKGSCSYGKVEEAKNRPLSVPEIEKQLKKTGNSPFVFTVIKIDADPDIFMPLSLINELRRSGIEALKEDMLHGYRRSL